MAAAPASCKPPLLRPTVGTPSINLCRPSAFQRVVKLLVAFPARVSPAYALRYCVSCAGAFSTAEASRAEAGAGGAA